MGLHEFSRYLINITAVNNKGRQSASFEATTLPSGLYHLDYDHVYIGNASVNFLQLHLEHLKTFLVVL